MSEVTLTCASKPGCFRHNVDSDATAYPHRGTKFMIVPGARWRSAADDERCTRWVKAAATRLENGADGGAYVNFLTENDGQDGNAFGANLPRLRHAKRQYDPGNLFRINQNIAPA